MSRPARSSIVLGLLAAAILAFMAGSCVVPYPDPKRIELEAAAGGPERTPVYRHGGYIVARASLHNHTTLSDGCRSPEDLLDLAQAQGMAILAYTDHREGKICVGKAVCLQIGGVEKIGYDAYYKRLRSIQSQAAERDMIVLKGVEVSPPWLYNYGRFPNIVVGGQHRHFTVYDIEDPSILADMPARREVKITPEPYPGDAPYQDFVDYIVEAGGIVHAVHVESGRDQWIATAHFVTAAPVYDLHLDRVTGFSVLPSAWRERTGGPGGLWDSTLLEYQAGMRDAPLWASADADYHGPSGSLANATTLFYMREFTESEVYRCMREGRMVALQGEAFQDVFVSKWSVSGEGGPDEAVMSGRSIIITGTPRIDFSLNVEVGGVKARLIRNGVAIREFEGVGFSYLDEEAGESAEPAYYRVELVGPRAKSTATMAESELFVNPIFIRFER